MEKSRQRRGRLTRLGWSLAIFLLLTPAPALAGSEWTLDAPEPVGIESVRAIDHDGLLQIEWLGGARSRDDDRDADRSPYTDGPKGEDTIFQLRGSEWT